ncbi:MAG TPA: glucose 1-dehydrogenase [Acidimicrobiales bacterium]|nr:glucose 1-dehydrogenase [Acidimicrobiales bacterium]
MAADSGGRLAGKAVIVTGASRGTGEVTARLLASHGANVALFDVRDDLGAAVAKDIGGDAIYVHCDVSSEADWAAGVAEVVERFGRLDVLVNNAAVLHLAALADTSVDDYMRVFRVNELGAFLGIKAVIEPMKAAGGGSIVNISSIDGVFVSPGTAPYAASKFAVRGLAKTAALELGKFGIRVNCVCPGTGNLDMVVEALPPELEREAIKDMMTKVRPRNPLRRHGELSDVADAVLFLASDESRFFTGADFVLDGGLSVGEIVPGGPGT